MALGKPFGTSEKRKFIGGLCRACRCRVPVKTKRVHVGDDARFVSFVSELELMLLLSLSLVVCFALRRRAA